MKKFCSLLFIVQAIFSFQGLAQTSSRTQNIELGASVHFFMEQAKKDLDQINKSLEALAKKTNSFATADTCSFIKLKFQKEYALWFINHEKEFTVLELEYQNQYQARELRLLQKIEELKLKTFPAVPVEGQTTTVTISLDSAVHYLNDFNARYRNQTEKTMPDFMLLQEEPQMNPPFYLAHSQILKSLARMTEGLNSALKQEKTNYKINFNMTKSGALLSIQEYNEQNKLLYSLSLLADAERDSLANFWRFLSTNKHQTVDQQPIDGIERIWGLQEKNKSYCLNQAKIPYFIRLPQDQAPYVSFELLNDSLVNGERKITQSKETVINETTNNEANNNALSDLEQFFSKHKKNYKSIKWKYTKYIFSTKNGHALVGIEINNKNLEGDIVYFIVPKKKIYSRYYIQNVIDKDFTLMNLEGNLAIRYKDQFNNLVIIGIDGNTKVNGVSPLCDTKKVP